MPSKITFAAALLAVSATSFAACASSDSANTTSTGGTGVDASLGGSAGQAGTGDKGGSSTGGKAGTAGVSAGGGSNTGGEAGTGGTGGTTGTGGVGGTGGAAGTGGISGAGGSSATGGNAGTAGNAGTGGAGATGGNSGTSGASGTGGAECAGTQPAAWVPVPGGYSIDETEVTRCQYKVWLDTNPTTTGQLPECDWNVSFTPGLEWPPGTKGAHPVVYVDWCDAHAYCKGVGKRLCGKIGGGPTPWGVLTDPAIDQWFNACSTGGVNSYPYGTTYDGTTCNGFDAGNGTTIEIGALAGCKTSSGVSDLSGNVWEWQDSCESAMNGTDRCRLRGGSFMVKTAAGMSCSYDYNHDMGNRNSTSAGVGFRCCSL